LQAAAYPPGSFETQGDSCGKANKKQAAWKSDKGMVHICIACLFDRHFFVPVPLVVYILSVASQVQCFIRHAQKIYGNFQFFGHHGKRTVFEFHQGNLYLCVNRRYKHHDSGHLYGAAVERVRPDYASAAGHFAHAYAYLRSCPGTGVAAPL
jgi:hypothetical protein